MNIILVGFMGCGKTTIGVRLSYRMKHLMTDTDKYIEHSEGMSVSEIFAQKGETYFRQKETQILKDFINDRVKDQVIATGGGMPVNPENRQLLKKLGVVVWLRVTPETVYERLKNDTTRPLLQTEDPMQKIKELMAQREDIYSDAGDFCVDVDGKSAERIMDEIFTRANGIWKKRKKEVYQL